MINLLRQSGVGEGEISNANKLFDSYLKYDHAKKIVSAITQEDSVPITVKQESEKLLQFSKNADLEKLQSASPSEFSKFVEFYNINSMEVEECIKDYEYYLEKDDLRRPEEW